MMSLASFAFQKAWPDLLKALEGSLPLSCMLERLLISGRISPRTSWPLLGPLVSLGLTTEPTVPVVRRLLTQPGVTSEAPAIEHTINSQAIHNACIDTIASETPTVRRLSLRFKKVRIP